MKQFDKTILGLNRVQLAKAFIFLAAGLSLIVSVFLYFTGEKQAGIYVGIWVPSILSAGLLMIVSGGENE